MLVTWVNGFLTFSKMAGKKGRIIIDNTPYDDREFLLAHTEVLKKEISKLKIKCALLEVMTQDAKAKLERHGRRTAGAVSTGRQNTSGETKVSIREGGPKQRGKETRSQNRNK